MDKDIQQPAKGEISSFVEPKTFEQAWFQPNPYQRKMWRQAIRKEYDDMYDDMGKRKVYMVKPRSELPANRQYVKSKWVFKIKCDGRFRARLLACSFSKNHIYLILAMVYFHLSGKIVDIKTAFLHGEPEEKIFMECPPGMPGVTKDHIFLLLVCIYGLVQAAKLYHKNAVVMLRNIGFEGGNIDPCLFIRKDHRDLCMVAVYVDNSILVRNLKAIDATIEELRLRKEGLTLTVEDEFNDYLSCMIKLSKDRTKILVLQPHLLSNLEKKFGEESKSIEKYLTLGPPDKYGSKQE